MTRVISATQLFRGQAEEGSERCFYCAGQCGQSVLASDAVRGSFTALDKTYGTGFVCLGCIEAMKEGIDLTTVDQLTRPNQKTRGYSWVVTRTYRLAFSKAHKQELYQYCIVPPQPPYVIAIAVSGQKHILYKAQVCLDLQRMLVCFEGESIDYRGYELRQRVEMLKRVCAVVGKPCLEEGLGTVDLVNVSDKLNDDVLPQLYQKVRNEPLTRLAVFFCPPKEVCLESLGDSAATAHG